MDTFGMASIKSRVKQYVKNHGNINCQNLSYRHFTVEILSVEGDDVDVLVTCRDPFVEKTYRDICRVCKITGTIGFVDRGL